MAYVISGHRNGDRASSTRLQRASAIVLAMSLLEKGYASVTITDNGGPPIDFAAFTRREQRLLRGGWGRHVP